MSDGTGSALDTYHVIEGQLTRRDGRVTRGRAGVVATVEAMDRFTSGFRYLRHDICCMVLETELAIQFAVATQARLERENKLAHDILLNYLKLPKVILSGDALGLLKNVGSTYAKLAKEVFAGDPHPVFARMGGHLVEILDDDRLLIYLNLNQWGRPYGFEYGQHAHTITRRLRGQRPMG